MCPSWAWNPARVMVRPSPLVFKPSSLPWRAATSGPRARTAPIDFNSRCSGADPSADSISAAAAGVSFAMIVNDSGTKPSFSNASTPLRAHSTSWNTPMVNLPVSAMENPLRSFGPVRRVHFGRPALTQGLADCHDRAWRGVHANQHRTLLHGTLQRGSPRLGHAGG